MDNLLDSLGLRSHDMIGPDDNLYANSITQAKSYFDALAATDSNARELHVTEFDVEQVWEQARTLLDQISRSILADIRTRPQPNPKVPKRKPSLKAAEVRNKPRFSSPSTRSGSEPSSVNFSEEWISESDSNSERIVIQGRHSSSDTPGARGDFVAGEGKGSGKVNGKDVTVDGIDDEFFSIEKFNRETQRFEHADEMGQPVSGLELPIDWNLDPGDMEDMSDSEEDGYSGLMYNDFFAPPGRLPSVPKSLEKMENILNEEYGERLDDLTEMMEGMRRDLFEEQLLDTDESLAIGDGDDSDENDENESEDGKVFDKTGGGTMLPNGETINMSSHTQRQIALNDQIRKLEKQNINKREWTLSGEALAKERPFNSLLEEDLDFERTGKSVPVITSDVTMSIEEMIKSRIVRGNFDDIARKMPAGTLMRRGNGLPELEDSKSKVGLAEIYEKEHLQIANQSNHQTTEETKFSPLRIEISDLFSKVSNQLDALSSWQFTPKTPKPTLSIVRDVRAISMEEANLNTATFSVSNAATLAPHEIFDPSSLENQVAGTTSKNGISVTNTEMSRNQKAKERRLRKRRNMETAPGRVKGTKSSRDRLLKSLESGNVSVIGKNGERVALSGEPRAGSTMSSATRMKL
ncbi:hypothetical protein ABW19_dt0205206 [Dactylella cylindrospora]|nr:hypothetical protein ABW19_dt0205206 [Dactylella cylindrospora]